jgi:tRNA(fMet)-specific endonuclease VapC
MNAIVVDTDVVSLVFKQDTRAQAYLAALAAPDLLVSFMTEAELERWILQARWGAERINRFRTYMKRFVSVPSSRDLIVNWAEVMVAAQSLGRRIEVADAWIAALSGPRSARRGCDSGSIEIRKEQANELR